MKTVTYKSGDIVKYRDGDARTFQVHTIYSKTHVSLGLYGYPDFEQDHQVHVSQIQKL